MKNLIHKNEKSKGYIFIPKIRQVKRENKVTEEIGRIKGKKKKMVMEINVNMLEIK